MPNAPWPTPAELAVLAEWSANSDLNELFLLDFDTFQKAVRASIVALAALPLEQRMEAMGMEPTAAIVKNGDGLRTTTAWVEVQK